jgi:hypothetical protein
MCCLGSTNWEEGRKLINYKKGRVIDIHKKYNSVTELLVEVEGVPQKAANFDKLTGLVQVGDDVLLNTTAVDLKLGSGGYHFVVSINNRTPVFYDEAEKGHIMKLRYTPLQFSVLSAEEQESRYHSVFDSFEGLNSMPVIIGELHSMILPVVFNAININPNISISYIMTDGGALPIDFSKTVSFLKQKGLINGTITFGQAFGGDVETVNVYTALIAADKILKSDMSIITMGPGITGTGTKYGFSGIEQGYIIDAVNTLGGNPIFIPRISFTDKRERHYGISHHSLTILNEICKTSAKVILPKFEGKKMNRIMQQLKQTQIEKKHKLVIMEDIIGIKENILGFDYNVNTMGRNLDKDTEFFLTAGAAGYYAAKLEMQGT